MFLKTRDRLLKRAGWKRFKGFSDFDGFAKTFTDASVRLIYQEKQLSNGWVINLYGSGSLMEFDLIFLKIYPLAEDRFVLFNKNFFSDSLCKDEYEKVFCKMLDDVDNWGESLSVDESIKEFSKERPDRPRWKQDAHLVALAHSAEFNTLMDYQQVFREGKRLNFAEDVTQDVIDRAVAIAIERYT